MESLHGLRGRKGLLVASNGGHLTQIVRWAARLGIDPASTFVTSRSSQSESLLAGRDVAHIPYIAPRDWRAISAAAPLVERLLRSDDFDFVLSTGAGIALACVPSVLIRRIPFHYIESVSRFEGPSVTGRILAITPRVHTWTQHRHWMNASWPFAGTLLDEFAVSDPDRNVSSGPLKIFVTLGTIHPYRFDRLIVSLETILEPGDEVVWQLGSSMRDDLRGNVATYLPHDEYRRVAREADVVIAQAGVGGILDLLDMGISPVVVPRRKQYGEHVDDHQLQAARVFDAIGLATHVEASELRRLHLIRRPRVQRT